MADLIRTLNQKNRQWTERQLLEYEWTSWPATKRPKAYPGDLLFVGWNGKIRLVAPVMRLDSAKKKAKPSSAVPKEKYRLVVGPFRKIRIRSEWQGHNGFPYVENLDEWNSDFDYGDLQRELMSAAKRYRESDEGQAILKKILRNAAARKKTQAKSEARERREFKKKTKNALWRRQLTEAPTVGISSEDRERYF